MGVPNFLSHDAYNIMRCQKPKIIFDILSSTRHDFSAEQINGWNLAYNTGWIISPGLVTCPSHSYFLQWLSEATDFPCMHVTSKTSNLFNRLAGQSTHENGIFTFLIFHIYFLGSRADHCTKLKYLKLRAGSWKALLLGRFNLLKILTTSFLLLLLFWKVSKRANNPEPCFRSPTFQRNSVLDSENFDSNQRTRATKSNNFNSCNGKVVSL